MSVLVLASRSAARRAMLEAAGVSADLDPADVDEAALKDRLLAGGRSPLQVAEALAAEKALAVSRRAPGRLVLGADQTLDQDGVLFDKAPDLSEAAERLRGFSGREHRLHSAAAIALDGDLIWTAVDTARLKVRNLSEDFIQAYVARNQEAALSSVGGYWLEAEGAQLFERVEGDYFTVLGLPLLSLLGFLRERGALPS
ncbi:Maf family protein [Brevundimonas sp.]|uniref:Maf family protein n=1 Tax=Brevundimonas sp. TaxID=1871086 RepID=UPI0025F23859|nr:Maf family protein [Brevundimonas sp.]